MKDFRDREQQSGHQQEEHHTGESLKRQGGSFLDSAQVCDRGELHDQRSPQRGVGQDQRGLYKGEQQQGGRNQVGDDCCFGLGNSAYGHQHAHEQRDVHKQRGDSLGPRSVEPISGVSESESGRHDEVDPL